MAYTENHSEESSIGRETEAVRRHLVLIETELRRIEKLTGTTSRETDIPEEAGIREFEIPADVELIVSPERRLLSENLDRITRILSMTVNFVAVIGGISAFYYLASETTGIRLSTNFWNLLSLGAAFSCLGLGGVFAIFNWRRRDQASLLDRRYGELQAKASALAVRIIGVEDDRRQGM
ncbi:MAG TPA: hypothetical protein VG889_08415 [Rhizomicrobium sp.]|nr:hypothetical protein [Rhizomicrobium sp.]